MLAGTSKFVISIRVQSYYSLLQNLKVEPAASQPVLPVPLHVQTDSMAASRPVPSLLNAGGVVFVENWTFSDIMTQF